ncbi:uncharacterized protein LOC131940301 [Physella acuta]|uniref:uncharacterized protein LOC131940301 n=1 Tax=Physella acuta TaxID=109671 RepID=UPI0027DB6D9E|nr:uncharacterized protein LOC131940301 [Physella acuta]
MSFRNRYINKFIILSLLSIIMMLVMYINTHLRCRSLVVDHVTSDRRHFDNSAIIHTMQAKNWTLQNSDLVVKKCDEQHTADRQRLYRDLLSDVVNQKKDMRISLLGNDVEASRDPPGMLPTTVHYVWCGEKLFKFEDYLGVLSVVRVLRPLKLVFHYNKLPVVERYYHTWFQELKQSLPSLELRVASKLIRCNTTDALDYGLDQLASSPGGGFYFGERALVTHIPKEWRSEKFFTYVTSGSNRSEQVFVLASQGHLGNGSTLPKYKINILNRSFECLTLDKFNAGNNGTEFNTRGQLSQNLSPCLAVPDGIVPEDIINETSPFASLARRLFYGKSEPVAVRQGEDPNDLIPNIGHVVSLNPQPGSPVKFLFQHYLAMLSALYLAKIERIYVHGDTVPSGEWWDRLQGENITFVYADNSDSVYQQPIKVPAHQSDILRTLILYKYGGIYFDKDVFWATPPSTDLRRYPSIMCLDWPSYGVWPKGGSIGLLMAKPAAPFLIKFLDSFWLYRDNSWEFNGVLMPYKVFERNPETLLIHKRLQVICFIGVCHPAWHDDFIRDIKDASKPTQDFNILEANAYHFTYPKPDPSLVSFDTIRNRNDTAAQLARMLIETIKKTGKLHLIAGSS